MYMYIYTLPLWPDELAIQVHTAGSTICAQRADGPQPLNQDGKGGTTGRFSSERGRGNVPRCQDKARIEEFGAII